MAKLFSWHAAQGTRLACGSGKGTPQRAPPWDSEKRMLWARSMVACGPLRHSHSLMAPPEVWDAHSSPASLPHLLNPPINMLTGAFPEPSRVP